MLKSENLCLYFVKYPEPGKVKTRLAKTVGELKAAQMYADLASENLKILRDQALGAADIAVLFAPADKRLETEKWLLGATHYWAQCNGGLGERLTGAFERGFREGYKKVMALGSDTLNFDMIETLRGFELLNHKDVVMGPCKDGGYYALSMKELYPQIFQRIDWSTEHVLDQTVERIQELGLTHMFMKEGEDLDEMSNDELISKN